MRFCAASACLRAATSMAATRHHFRAPKVTADLAWRSAQKPVRPALSSDTSQTCFSCPTKIFSRKALNVGRLAGATKS